MPVVPTAPGLFVVSPKVTCRRDGRSLVAVAFSPSRVAAVRTRAGAKNPKAPRASADPGSADDWFAGCESQHQQTTFAKKKRHDVVFFVKQAPRASADPGSADDWFAGCESQHQQTTFAKKKRHDVVFFVKQAPRAFADPGSPRAAILSDFLRIAYNSTIEPDYASR
jgi:hypothetical protein